MDVYRKTIILILIILLITSIAIPSINASKIIFVNNIFNNHTYEPEPPVTSFCFNEDTGYVALIAIDYPIYHSSGVNATYYKIDNGETQTYQEPFKLPEGLHIVTFWSIDNIGLIESRKSRTLMCDTEPPIVEIIRPKAGTIYLFGAPFFNRIFSETTIYIGQVPVIVNADDKNGYGVSRVFFSYSDRETSYDDESSDGWSNTYSNMHFGNLTISVSAMDKKGLVSEPINITIKVYSFGLFIE